VIDAGLGGSIWSTADGVPRIPLGLREIGRSFAERSVPTLYHSLTLFKPAVVAGYFGVADRCVEPGQSLGLDPLSSFAERCVITYFFLFGITHNCLDLKEFVRRADEQWPDCPPTPTETDPSTSHRPLPPLPETEVKEEEEKKKKRPLTPYPNLPPPSMYPSPNLPDPTWAPQPGEFRDLNLLAGVVAEQEAVDVPTPSVSDGPTVLPSGTRPLALAESPAPLIDLDEALSRGMGQEEFERLVGEDPRRWYATRLLLSCLMRESDWSPGAGDLTEPDPFLPTPPPSPKEAE
jgi:hypothetical protein